MCKVDNCTNKLFARGHCVRHYRELLNTPALPRIKGSAEGVCSIDNCETRIYAKNYCRSHYERNRKHGDPEYTKPTQGHGTMARYSRGCRCEPCQDARRVYVDEYNQKRRDNLPCGDWRKYTAGCRCKECRGSYYLRQLEILECGNPNKYSAGCRCDTCRKGYSEYKAKLYRENPAYRESIKNNKKKTT